MARKNDSDFVSRASMATVSDLDDATDKSFSRRSWDYSLFTFMLPSNKVFALNLLIISRCYLRM